MDNKSDITKQKESNEEILRVETGGRDQLDYLFQEYGESAHHELDEVANTYCDWIFEELMKCLYHDNGDRSPRNCVVCD